MNEWLNNDKNNNNDGDNDYDEECSLNWNVTAYFFLCNCDYAS